MFLVGRTHYHYKPTNGLLETMGFILPTNPSPTYLFTMRVLISFTYLTNIIYNSSRDRVRDPLTIKYLETLVSILKLPLLLYISLGETNLGLFQHVSYLCLGYHYSRLINHNSNTNTCIQTTMPNTSKHIH